MTKITTASDIGVPIPPLDGSMYGLPLPMGRAVAGRAAPVRMPDAPIF